MSTDRKVIVGSFVKCKVETKPVGVKCFGCRNCNSQFSVCSQNKFCSRCGDRFAKYDRQEDRDAVCLNDVTEEIKEALWGWHGDDLGMLGLHFYFGNKRNDGCGQSFDPDETGSFVVDVGGDMEKEKEKDDFLAKYADAIKVLRERYGDENVEVCWGVVFLVW